MNPHLLLHRLHEPRSNLASTLLLTATFLLFALVAETATRQQEELADGERGAPAERTAPLPFGLQALIHPLQF